MSISEATTTIASGRYVLLDALGRGASAEVWRARDTQLQVDRAVKLLTADNAVQDTQKQRFTREAKVMARMHHPNIVTIHDFGTEEHHCYLVMDCYAGGTLQDQLQSHGPLSLQAMLPVALAMTSALAYAHEKGIVHRDIKPSNIMLDDSGAPYLADFGLARHEDAGGALTQSVSVLGTWAYLAPECRIDPLSYTQCSDVFGMGVLMYVLLTNEEPQALFDPEEQEDCFEEFPEAFTQLLQRCCAKDPTQRPQSAVDLHAQLQQVYNTLFDAEDAVIAVSGPVGGTGSVPLPRPQPARPTAPAATPTGVVTLVFTDIEAFTRMWEQFGERFHEVLEVHNQVIGAQIQIHQGIQIRAEGDTFFVAFHEPQAAVEFAMSTQIALHQAEWPHWFLDQLEQTHVLQDPEGRLVRGIRVRMGIHTGQPESVQGPFGNQEYQGHVVTMTGQLCDVAHGGQILVSEITRALLADVPLQAVWTRVTANHHTQFSGREAVIQVLPPELKHRAFPPLRQLARAETNLTGPVPKRFGQRASWEAVLDAFQTQEHLIVLVGPPGVGKTSLALAAAQASMHRFAGGVWRIDVSGCSGPSDVYQRIMMALGRSDVQAPITANDVSLRETSLLIFDNVAQCGLHMSEVVERLCAQDETLTCLLTSQRLMDFGPARIIPVAPLSSVDTETLEWPLSAVPDSMALFEERARVVKPSFALSKDNVQHVAQIVTELGGNPLAIELAAGRMRLMPPERLAARLQRRFQLLKQGGRSAAVGQRSLEAAIDAVWARLGPLEQQLWMQCAGLPLHFSLEHVEQGAQASFDAAGEMVVDGIEQLLAAFILVPDGGSGAMSFHMCPNLRAYGLEKLSGAL